MARTRLQAIDVEELDQRASLVEGQAEAAASAAMARLPPPANGKTFHSVAQSALTGLLTLSLTALSQRALIALASLVEIVLIGSVFVVWLSLMVQPSTPQLIGGGMYAAFILACLWVRR